MNSKRTSSPRTEQLLQLAARLDHTSQSIKSQCSVADSIELTQEEQRELDRIQGALAFIHQVHANDGAEKHAPLQSELVTPTETRFSTPAIHTTDGQASQTTPKRVGRFEIIRLLGQGGFAKVYLAHDPHLNRDVALKLLKTSLFFSDDVMSRFQREARAAAVLNHPNIIPVFESGNIDGQPFIASAFCDGMTLEAWKEKQDSIEVRTAATIVAELADAVEHAHQRGIIHRDLKPANVLIDAVESVAESTRNTRQGLPGALRITDFGLAKDLARVDQLQTAEGAIVGTPAYMAPEQAVGKSLTATSDVYSLGVILYELLTGRLPILKDTNIATLLAIKTDEAPAPRSLRREIPRDLEAICLKCLSKSSEDRYSSAHQLGADLRCWLHGEPILARRASRLERVAKWVKKNPLLSTAFVGLSIATMVAVFQWSQALSEYGRAEANLRLANEENQRAQKHLALSQDVIDSMVVQVADDTKLPPQLRRSVAEKASRFQDQLQADAPRNEAVALKAIRGHNRLAQMLFDMADYEAGLKSANKAIEIGSRFSESKAIAPIVSFSKNMKAGILVKLKRTKESRRVSEEAKKAAKTPTQKAAIHFALGMAKMEEQAFESALKEFETAIDLIRDDTRAFTKFPRARGYLFAARAEMNLKRYEAALKHSRIAEKLFASLLDTGHGGLVVNEEVARCRIQQAETQVAALNSDDFQGDTSKYIQQAEASLMKAENDFETMFQKRPNVDRYVGQQAYCIDVLCQLYERADNLESLQAGVDRFAELIETIGSDNVHVNDIRESYLQQRERLITVLHQKEKFLTATDQVDLLRQAALDFAEKSKEERFQRYIHAAGEWSEKMKASLSN